MNDFQSQNKKEKRESWRDILREFVFEGDNAYARIVDIILIILIVASIIAVVLETIPSIHSKYGALLWGFEWLFTIIFTIEYVLRVLSSKNPNKFIFSFHGFIDFVSILPLYIIIIFGGSGLITMVRALRLIRIGSRIARLSKDFSDAMHFFVHIKSNLGSNEHIIHYFKRSRKRLWFGYLVIFLMMCASIAEIVFHYFSGMWGDSTIIRLASYILFGLSTILFIKYEISTWYERYAITNHRVVVSIGIFHEDFKGTTYSYIADTYLYQTFIQRILNIGRIQIKTTGSEHQNIELTAVSKPLMVKKLIHDNIIRIHHLHYEPHKHLHHKQQS